MAHFTLKRSTILVLENALRCGNYPEPLVGKWSDIEQAGHSCQFNMSGVGAHRVAAPASSLLRMWDPTPNSA
jgi:hypothetical protein